jgi:enamine deaminase RidA (YjgF/YER057c/UK114 family)
MTIQRVQPGKRMSQAVVHGDTVYLAGQVALGKPGGSVAEQTTDILARIDALLQEVGSDRTKLLSATIWLADMATFDEMNGVWDAWLPEGGAPARATVEARLAAPQFTVEIGIIAAR